jgi:hypothetical protein
LFAVLRTKTNIDLIHAQTAYFQEFEKKCRYEDTLVRNLEEIREGLLHANREHLERGLQQGWFFLHRFASITLLFRRLNTSRPSANLFYDGFCSSCRCNIWILNSKNKMSLNINVKLNMKQDYRLKLAGLITAPPSTFDPASAFVLNSYLV